VSERPRFRVPDCCRQVRFHQYLVAARKTWLLDALSAVLRRLDPEVLRNQLSELVPRDARQVLAGAGIRDEHVFPAPVLLEEAPNLLGYYRLLLGIPQKSFYGRGTGLGRFKNLETKGQLTEGLRSVLPALCGALCAPLAEMVRQISPRITPRDVAELPLLTFGAYLQGANNVRIGQQATRSVFLSIVEITRRHVTQQKADMLLLENASGRRVRLTLRSDPDIGIEEEFKGQWRKKVAIEIKGGTDRSNAHNRAGEAEKSHIKARRRGFRDCWTVIAKKGLDLTTLSSESPSTKSWFDAAQVLAREGEDWEQFKSHVAETVGIPLE